MTGSKKIFSPGETTPISGQYGILDKGGRRLQTEITAIKGKPLPPTKSPGQRYTLNDPTKHKGVK